MKNLGKEFSDPEFETDACTFRIGNEDWLFSTDEFSSEDNFRCHNAAVLGWNVAAATISDILAAGGVPAFYGHTVTMQDDWDEDFLNAFSKSIASCLDQAGAAFLGGDLGKSDKWRYTGIALGKKSADINRKGAEEGDVIYMTGNAGAGNLEAALRLYSGSVALESILNRVHVSFPLRIKEAALVRKYANCCIDSSDGLFRAVLDLARIGGKGFNLHNIPYNHQGLLACRVLGKPGELLFLGECGEYELVFTLPAERENELISEARALNLAFARIGTITNDQKMILNTGKKCLDLAGYSIFARNYSDVKQYINDVVQFVKNG